MDKNTEKTLQAIQQFMAIFVVMGLLGVAAGFISAIWLGFFIGIKIIGSGLVVFIFSSIFFKACENAMNKDGKD